MDRVRYGGLGWERSGQVGSVGMGSRCMKARFTRLDPPRHEEGVFYSAHLAESTKASCPSILCRVETRIPTTYFVLQSKQLHARIPECGVAFGCVSRAHFRSPSQQNADRPAAAVFPIPFFGGSKLTHSQMSECLCRGSCSLHQVCYSSSPTAKAIAGSVVLDRR